MIELVLAKFRDGSQDNQAPGILLQMADDIRETLRKSGRSDGVVDVSNQEILVDLPGGTAAIRSDTAIFPITELDPLTLHVIFYVAKIGDMVVLTEGGNYSAIVIEPSQRNQLPEAKWRSEHISPLCRSPEELQRLLEGWHLAHSKFKQEAIADWTAKSESIPSSTAQSTGGVRYAWDPWLQESVANGPEAEFLELHHFDPLQNEIPAHPNVLSDLRDICERHIQENKGPHSRLIEDDQWPPLSLRMQLYSIDFWPCRVKMSTYVLNDSFSRLVFEIARVGDMSFILPGSLVLTDPSQDERLPQSWKQIKKVFSCRTPEELKSLLIDQQIDIPQEDRDGGIDAQSVPGTFPKRNRTIYVEVKPEETAEEHQKKTYSHKSQGPDGRLRPASGMMMAEFWQLETPTGRRFLAYAFGAEGWLEHIRDFAALEERMCGEIVNFETLVQGDGQRFPLSDCKAFKVD